MSDEKQQLSRSFGSVAAAYDVGRPGYPEQAARWLMGSDARTVLELGAGTGKLTEELVRQGHDVHATDPDPEMLRVLKERCPGVRTDIATAEAIPLPDRSVDVVVAAQAFHWFDAEQALPEIARVLKPGGHLALVWNVRDERIPWVKKLGRIIHNPEADHSTESLVESELFGFVDAFDVTHWQHVNRVTIVDLVSSRSSIATMEEGERDAKIADVLALYDDYGRGMDGMELPYRAFCYKAAVADRRTPNRPDSSVGATDSESGSSSAAGSSSTEPGEDTQPIRTTRGDSGPTPPPADGDTGEFLLIDFR